MIRVMIFREKNGIHELYTAGGANVDEVLADVTKIMSAPKIVSCHAEIPEKMLIELAHKLEAESGGLS